MKKGFGLYQNIIQVEVCKMKVMENREMKGQKFRSESLHHIPVCLYIDTIPSTIHHLYLQPKKSSPSERHTKGQHYI